MRAPREDGDSIPNMAKTIQKNNKYINKYTMQIKYFNQSKYPRTYRNKSHEEYLNATTDHSSK